MAAEARIEQATAAHAEALAPLMRAEDAAEVLASSGKGPRESLLSALSASERAWALLVNGEVAALWGVAPAGRTTLVGRGRVGVVWLLTGRAIDRHRRLFLRLARPALGRLHRLYPILLNAVDARYVGALRLLRWLGAELAPAEPFGAAGLPFHPFIIRSSHV